MMLWVPMSRCASRQILSLAGMATAGPLTTGPCLRQKSRGNRTCELEHFKSALTQPIFALVRAHSP